KELKKEINQCNICAFDLDSTDKLRGALMKFKTRYEEFLDEIKGIDALATLKDLQAEIADNVSNMKVIKAQAKAVLSVRKKEKKDSAASSASTVG
ncbi:unnamed protein product, partial [Durusdinium trenchii]